jgi:hypothetical protein
VNVTPVTDISACPFGDIEDAVALKTNLFGSDLILFVLGRNLGPVYDGMAKHFAVSITIVGGCDATPQFQFNIPDLLGHVVTGMRTATPDFRLEASK